MDYGVLIVLPDVVVYEDVLDVAVEGVDPQWLPPTDGEGVTGPPTYREEEEEDERTGHGH